MKPSNLLYIALTTVPLIVSTGCGKSGSDPQSQIDSNRPQSALEEKTLDSLQTDLPVFLGDPREKVRATMGEPTSTDSKNGYDYDVYEKRGVVFAYKPGSSEVFYIQASSSPGGNATGFKGKIMGISMADPVSACETVWGKPVHKKSGHMNTTDNVRLTYYFASYVRGGFAIDIKTALYAGDGPGPIEAIKISRREK